MKWRNRQGSSNVRNGGRGAKVGGAIGGGGLLIGIIVFILTGNPLAALNAGLGGGSALPTTPSGQQELQLSKEEQDLYDFSAVALKDTEDTWETILQEYGEDYNPAEMVIFKEQFQSGCGLASSGTGPFYCSADQRVYMDLSFYRMLIEQFGTDEGYFTMSYVISHEIGHHVQDELGILDQVNQERARVSEAEANELTVRLELQADYLAGVVARYQEEQGYLERGDLDLATKTAWSIGDDTIQKRTQGYVMPESYTHGTSDQRSRWYRKGYEAGDLSEYNTFDYNMYPDTSQM